MGKKINIEEYKENFTNWKVIVFAVLLSCLIAWLFYRSFWGLVVFPFVYIIILVYFTNTQKEKRREKVLLEFKEMLGIICIGLRSGHSLENVIEELDNDLKKIEENAEIMSGIILMKKQLKIKKTVEDVIGDFAKKYPYEEIESFSYMIGFAKRLGGNYIKNISLAADKLQSRIEVRQEVRTTLAEKQLEMKIMGVMPLAILVYIGITSYEFIAPLYNNLEGVLIMTGCLIAYVILLFVGKKIITVDW